jgi:hypothetical protein
MPPRSHDNDSRIAQLEEQMAQLIDRVDLLTDDIRGTAETPGVFEQLRTITSGVENTEMIVKQSSETLESLKSDRLQIKGALWLVGCAAGLVTFAVTLLTKLIK